MQYNEQTGHRGDKMFAIAIDQICKIRDLLREGWTYRGEYLQKPKHNTLCYDRVPKGNIIIFDIDQGDNEYLNYNEKMGESERIGLECVPLIFEGTFDLSQDILALLKKPSILGGTTIEGMVFKQYEMLDQQGNVVMAKYVSEAFKEMHVKDWKGQNPGKKDVLEAIIESLRTTARWQKALQHLKECGKLEHEPSDIGKLVAEIQLDTMEEGIDYIKQQLFKWALPHIKRGIVRGVPEWYKGLLAQRIDEDISKAN